MSAIPLRRPDAPVKLLLTSKEAACALCISERTLWELTQPRGPIPVLRIGGRGLQARHLRYRLVDLEAYCASLLNPDAAATESTGASIDRES